MKKLNKLSIVGYGASDAAMTFLALLVMSKYKLTDAMHAQTLGEIRARREDGAVGDGAVWGRPCQLATQPSAVGKPLTVATH